MIRYYNDLYSNFEVETDKFTYAVNTNDSAFTYAFSHLSAFAVPYQQLVYLPVDTSAHCIIRDAQECAAYYTSRGVEHIVLQEVPYAVTGIAIVCKTEEVFRQKFKASTPSRGTVYDKTGVLFGEDTRASFLNKLIKLLDKSDFWELFDTGWAIIECDLPGWTVNDSIKRDNTEIVKTIQSLESDYRLNPGRWTNSCRLLATESADYLGKGYDWQLQSFRQPVMGYNSSNDLTAIYIDLKTEEDLLQMDELWSFFQKKVTRYFIFPNQDAKDEVLTVVEINNFNINSDISGHALQAWISNRHYVFDLNKSALCAFIKGMNPFEVTQRILCSLSISGEI